MKKFYIRKTFLLAAAVMLMLGGLCPAVTSKITRHRTATDLLKGETENTIIDSEGTIKLARDAAEINCGRFLKDVWIINSVVADSAGTIYLGTSPNGNIIKYSDGEATRIYPLGSETHQLPVEDNDSSDPNAPKAEEAFVNEHIFAMAMDSTGWLLAALSGADCRLMRFENGQFETIYEPDGATYILAITLDDFGNIYLGTGPEGKIYRLDPAGENPQLVYDCTDKNVLSLTVGEDDFVYAGCDQRGLIYKINPANNAATVLYDSEQSEITALLFDEEDNLYVTATSAEAVKSQVEFSSISASVSAGRPDTRSKSKGGAKKTGTTKLKIANISKAKSKGAAAAPPAAKRGEPAKQASYIYKIDPQGFVTDIFSEKAVFFTLVSQDDELLVGTGNNAQLFAVDPETEQKAIAYEDKQASQITALVVSGDELYSGTSNPAKLIRLSKSFADKGTFASDLVDAGQPAMWGKLQIDADIPAGCKVMMSARSGNVKDPNDPTFSPWSEEEEVTEATQLTCPLGRYCQYKLTLETVEPAETPVIREVAVPHVVPNLSPKVMSVTAARDEKKKQGFFGISYKAQDDNKDTLIYKIEFRKVGRTKWIKLEDEFAKTKFEWDSKTVEDGRYEVRVTADDERSNTTTTKLAGSRISDPFVVDNTAAVIQSSETKVEGSKLAITLEIKDKYSAIGKVSYTVDSNEDWVATLPDDMVYDTTSEFFTIVIEDLENGEHIVALKISDDLENTMYKTFDIEIE